MSVSFCVVFEAEVPPHGTLGANNPSLTSHRELVDRIAGENTLIPLGDFQSYDPGDASEFLDEEELEGLPEVQ